MSYGTFKFYYNATRELSVGTSVSVECEEGYGPVMGYSNITCSSTLHWEPVTPGCQKLCPKLNLTSSGCTANTSATFPGTTVGLFAENGLTKNLTATLTCLAEGHWNPLPPDCVGVLECPPLTVSANLQPSTWNYSIGSHVIFRCVNGLKMSGSAVSHVA